MGKEYYSKEDAAMRLHGTICMYDGSPVYVDATSPGSTDPGKVFIYHLGDAIKLGKGYKVVDYRDDKFVYKSPPLGYMFYENKARYVSRIPDRKQRQGLSVDVVRVNPYPEYNDSHFTSQAMSDCILGKYHTLTQAESLVNNGVHSVPISRRLAIVRERRGVTALAFRGRTIGYKEGDSYRLLNIKEKPFLLKTIKAAGVPVT